MWFARMILAITFASLSWTPPTALRAFETQQDRKDGDSKEKEDKDRKNKDGDDKDNDKDKDEKNVDKKHKPKLTGRFLLQVITTDEDADRAGSLGEQALIHRLFTIDLASKTPLAEVTLGAFAQVSQPPHVDRVWVTTRQGPTDQTRLREFGLPNLAVLQDLTSPIVLHGPTDPSGVFLANQRIVALGNEHILVIGRQATTPVGQQDFMSMDVSATGLTVTKLADLQSSHLGFVDLFNISSDTATLLFGFGDALSVSTISGTPVAAPSPGVTPITLDPALVEGVRLSSYNLQTDSIVACTGIGNVVKRARGAQANGPTIATDAAVPEELSVEPGGVVAAIRYKIAPDAPTSSVSLVNLSTSQQIAVTDLPSNGAILQLDARRTLYADGSTLNILDIGDVTHPQKSVVFTLKNVPTFRIVKMIALSPAK